MIAKQGSILFLVAGVILSAAAVSSGEIIVRKDGARIQGRIVSQDGDKVVLEIRKYGAKMTTEIDRDDIDKILPDPKQPGDGGKPNDGQGDPGQVNAGQMQGPDYVLLDLQGQVGIEVTEEFLARAFRLTNFNKVGTVVLVISLDGGMLDEAGKIVTQLQKEAVTQKFVAYVKTARGAGAAVALACPKIVFAPGGILSGKPTRNVEGDKDTPASKEKNADLSELLLRAARVGNHSDLIAKGLADPNLDVFHQAKADGKIELTQGPAGAKVKDKGDWWLVKADLAEKLGLSLGTQADPEKLHETLKADQTWKRTYVGADKYLERVGPRARRDYERKLTQQAQQERIKELKPQLDAIDAKIAVLEAKAKSLVQKMELLEKEYKVQVEAAEAAHEINKKRLREIENQEGVDIDRLRRELKDYYEKALKTIKASYGPRVEQLRREMRRVQAEAELLQKEKRDLIRGAEDNK